jgi:hypothetical protein
MISHMRNADADANASASARDRNLFSHLHMESEMAIPRVQIVGCGGCGAKWPGPCARLFRI